jgi:transcription elongation factor GreB
MPGKAFWKKLAVKSRKNYITPLGFKRLQDEYDHLVKVIRPHFTEIVKWAASLGDRSENADYQYGKRKLRSIDSRLRFLSKRIEASLIVDPENLTGKNVKFGATLKIEDEEGEGKVYSIVGVDEINLSKGLISWQSPLGKGLIGKEEGESVEIKTPGGAREFEIIDVNYKKIEIEEYKNEDPS